MSSVSATKAQPDIVIRLTAAEIQGGMDRQDWAEGLILQLPESHDGRNAWLMNYGLRFEAASLREKHGLKFNPESRAVNPPVCDPRLRDEFAMSALDGLLASPGTQGEPEFFAELSYSFADAMLQARK